MAAAVAAHAAIIAGLIAPPALPERREESTTLSVALVAPPPEPASPTETAQPNAPTAPAVAAAGQSKRPGKPRSHSDPSHASPPPQKPEEDESPGVYGSAGTQRLPEGTAAYRVVVGRDGAVQSIVLMRSSGVTSYDAAGVTMIRTTMRFDPPARSSGNAATIVTISFSPTH